MGKAATADRVLARAAAFVPITVEQNHAAALKALLRVVWVERLATAIGLVILVGLSLWTLLRVGTTRVGTAIVHDTMQSLTSPPATDPASGVLLLAGLVVMVFAVLGLRGLAVPQR